MTIPPEMLRHLRHLEGYDRSLELDRMARLHGTASEAIERFLQTEQPVEVSTVGPPHPNLERSCHSRMEGPIGPYTTRVRMRSVARP